MRLLSIEVDAVDVKVGFEMIGSAPSRIEHDLAAVVYADEREWCLDDALLVGWRVGE